jgi:ABC-type cobalamin/Fe3+-siderophores transport system ATPase subunit
MTIGSSRPMEDAARIAYRELVRWMAADFGFEELDAYMRLTQCGRVRLGIWWTSNKANASPINSPAGNTRAAYPASALSHGQQQWLEIAMALASEPKLLLLDEPTGGMSLEERRVTGELLQPIKKRCSLVIVEHDLDFIRDICDRLTVLDQGSVLDYGTVQHIQLSTKVQEVYLRRA